MQDGSKTFSFLAAMKDFFGMQPGQSLKDFGAELKKLTDEDRAEFKAGLEANGYTITAATIK